MRKIVFAYILFQVLFVSCKKINWDSENFLCGATINGSTYKDVTTLYKDLFEGVFMPFNDKVRTQIERDSIAYLQFRLVNSQNQEDCFYLYGGIAFDKNEVFPQVNKNYDISYESKFNSHWMFKIDELHSYLVENRDKGTVMLPFGIMMIKDYKAPGVECYGNFSLSGTLVFDSYNPKTRKCVGHFKLTNEHVDGVNRTYTIEGQFNTELCNRNNVDR